MAATTVGGFLATHSCRQRLQVRAANSNTEDEEFEARLAKIRRRSGKKAASTATTTTSPGGGRKKKELVKVLLPPVPLSDPVSDGLSVELGFNPYTERLNGRLAGLGLAALLLVELATGGSFIKFHDPSIIAVQAYTVLSITALFIKFEKERKSIWPSSSSSTSSSSSGNQSN